jgi:hypothetical protein
VTLAAGVAAVYEGLQWKKNNDNLKAISTDDPNVLRYHTEAEWFSLQSKRNKSLLYTGISAAVAVIGVAGFVWSFTF